MKWIGISGGWRRVNLEVEQKVREMVRQIIARGDGIVSGGALGVDFIALNEALENSPKADKIKIFLPTTLEIYAAHYRKRAQEDVITSEQAEILIGQLTRLKNINPRALIENQKRTIVDKEAYYERNSEVVSASDELIAFHIKTEMSEGLGTQDTIEKAKQKGIQMQIFSFDLTKNKNADY